MIPYAVLWSSIGETVDLDEEVNLTSNEELHLFLSFIRGLPFIGFLAVDNGG